MEVINTAQAPSAIGPYSQAVRVGNTVYFSGQIPLLPSTMQLIDDDFRQQALQTFANVRAVAMAAGGGLDKVVKLTIYVTDLANFSIVNEVMLLMFQVPYPVRTTIQVTALPLGAKIEVEAVMVI